MMNDEPSDEGTVGESLPGENSRYHTRHTDEKDVSLSVTVVEALAEVKGVSPVELERPLYDTIDPDALDRLFVSDDADGATSRLVFSTDGYEVTVHSDGHIYVRSEK